MTAEVPAPMSPSDDLSQRPYVLRFQVKDSSGEPLRSARVTIGREPVLTDETPEGGRVEFASADPDRFRFIDAVVVEHPDHVTHRAELELGEQFYAERTREIVVQLQQGPELVIVLRDEAGNPVAAGIVRVRRVYDEGVIMPTVWVTPEQWLLAQTKGRLGGSPIDTGLSDAEGRAKFRLEPGRYAMTAWKSGFVPREDRDFLLRIDAALLEVTYRLEAGLSLSGRVIDAAGEGVAGAAVLWEAVSTQRSRVYGRTESTADGAFLAGGIPATGLPCLLLCTKDGFAPRFDQARLETQEEKRIPLDRGRTLTLELVDATTSESFEPDGALAWRVRDVDPKVLALWLKAGRELSGVEVREGSCLLKDIPWFARDVELRLPGWTPAYVPLPRDDRNELRARIALSPSEQYSIALLDARSGERIQGADLRYGVLKFGPGGEVLANSMGRIAPVHRNGVDVYLLSNAQATLEAEVKLSAAHPRYRTATALYKVAGEEAAPDFVIRMVPLD